MNHQLELIKKLKDLFTMSVKMCKNKKNNKNLAIKLHPNIKHPGNKRARKQKPSKIKLLFKNDGPGAIPSPTNR